MRRQTDFFLDQKAAEKVIVDECKKQYLNWESKNKEKLAAEAEKQKREAERKKKQ